MTETATQHDPYQIELATALECDPDDLTLESWDNYGLPVYSGNGCEYAIGDDEECDKAATEYIRDSLWAFNASFLSSETGLPEDMFTAAQDRCEGANNAFLQVVEQSCGLDSFVESAISADGRGHFMSSYDGEEHETGSGLYYYRIN